MTFTKDFISQCGMAIVYAVLTAIAGFFGTRLTVFETIVNKGIN